MRLRALLSDFPKTVIDALDGCGIKTDEDLLCSASSLPDLWLRLPPDSMTFAQLEEIREIAIKSLSASGSSVADTLDDLITEDIPDWWLRLQSTCPNLTDLLNATQAGVIEVSGDKGSGKTALILNAALACLEASEDNVAHWIDTTGDFSAERASRILNYGSWSQGKIDSDYTLYKLQAAISTLNRLNVSLAFTPVEAHAALESIRSQTSEGIRSHLTSHDLAHSGSSEGQAMISAFMRSLQDLAVDLGAIALISNNASASLPANTTSSFEATKLKPALGLTMTFLTDATVWLTPAKAVFTSVFKSGADSGDQSDLRPVAKQLRGLGGEDLDNMYIAEVLRSRSYTGPTWWSLRLDENGVLGELRY